MKRVLVLGTSGMLGAMVFQWLSRCSSLSVAGTSRMAGGYGGVSPVSPIFQLHVGQSLEPQFERILADFPADYIVNCIGIINVDCRDHDVAGVREAVRVNADFPHELNALLGRLQPEAAVIHITTDCVYSGLDGNYNEDALADPPDFYGKSKLLGEVSASRWLNLRCSIIGPNPRERRGLLEWVRTQPRGEKLSGFQHHRWNGVTTLQFAQVCEEIITKGRFEAWRALNGTLHYAPNRAVTKYELIQIIDEVFACGLEIKPVSIPAPPIDRTLTSKFLPSGTEDIANAVRALKQLEDSPASPGSTIPADNPGK